MSDRIDAVPEGDFAEQQTSAYPESDSEITPIPADDTGWTADEGDLVEQSISVPIDDEYADGESEY